MGQLRWALPGRIVEDLSDRCRYGPKIGIEQDLLGDWAMVQCWDGLDSGLGQYRIEMVVNHDRGRAALEALDERRRKYGYV